MTVWPNGLRTIPRVSSEFGPRVAPLPGASTFHRGIDLVGFPINKSPCVGIVAFAAYNGGAGNMVTIRGDNGDRFIMMHNARLLVKLGQRVVEGQDLGVMGTTGASTGVHTHLETHPRDQGPVNPRVYMAAAIGSDSADDGATPIIPQPRETSDMKLLRTTDGVVYFATAGGVTTVDNPEQLGVLQRFLKAAPESFDTFNEVQRNWIIGYINRASGDTAEYNNILAAIRAADDSGDITAAVVTLKAAIMAQSAPVPHKFTDAELAKIGSSVPAFDSASVVAAIEQSQAEVLSAIAGVDEATLAAFGLKRN